MASTRSRSRQASNAPDPIIEARAKRICDNVREHWERGQKARRERNLLSRDDLAELESVNPNTLRKDRRFAQLYSQTELKELLKIRRPGGMPLHWGHVIYLFTVPGRADRKWLQKEAARHGWSAPEMCEAIRRQRPQSTGRGGRHVKVPSTPEARLRELSREASRWLRRFDMLWGGKDDNLAVRLKAGKDDSMRLELQELSKTLSQMGRRVAAAAKVIDADAGEW